MRQACYTLGIVANQLISPSSSNKDNDEERKQDEKIDFSKFLML